MTTAEVRDIVDAFELLGDWEERYRYLVELGERMPEMAATEKIEENRVNECMSMVYVAAHRDPARTGRVIYVGDCDTAVIKGVVALLVGLLSGKTPREVEDLDVDELFEGLHLEEHLSPNRHVGVYAIVDRMKRQARALAG
jgi:cysteine desulfuration protein SufE